MQRERRLIWTEDRYRLLGRDGSDRYYGRLKGNSYFVYRKRGDSVRRETVQNVDGEQDWFWDSASNRLVDFEPDLSESVLDTSSLTMPPNEHVLRGYLNSKRLEDLTASTIDDGRGCAVTREVVLGSGARAILLSPTGARGSVPNSKCEWVVSLHGGPESLEGTEIRYCGLYRELLRRGLGVAILNYRGSLTVEKSNSISWKTAIEQDFDSLILSLGQPSSVSVMGASFGGALALMVSRSRSAKRLLLLSPLLDLAHQRDRGGADFRAWFDSKFSPVDFEDIALSKFAPKNASSAEGPQTCLIYGTHDEVLGHQMFERYAEALRQKAGSFVFRHDGPHQPINYRDVIFQLTRSYAFLTESTETVSVSATPD